jgi:hypothetical protein
VGAIKRALRDRSRPLWEAHRRGRRDAPETIFEPFKEAADQVADAWLAGQEQGLVIHTMRAIDYFHVDKDTLILLPSKRVKSGVKPAESRLRWKPFAQLRDRILIASWEDLQAIALDRPLSPYCVLGEAVTAAQEDQLVALFKRCPVAGASEFSSFLGESRSGEATPDRPDHPK